MTDAEIYSKNWNRYTELLEFFDCFTPEQEAEFLKICAEIACAYITNQNSSNAAKPIDNLKIIE
jgi:hypothetical protein